MKTHSWEANLREQPREDGYDDDTSITLTGCQTTLALHEPT